MADEERRDRAHDRDHSPSSMHDADRERQREPSRREEDVDDWRHERGRPPLTDRERRERWPVG